MREILEAARRERVDIAGSMLLARITTAPDEVAGALVGDPDFARALATGDEATIGMVVLQRREELAAAEVARAEPDTAPYRVACSCCGGAFLRPIPAGFSHCWRHRAGIEDGVQPA